MERSEALNKIIDNLVNLEAQSIQSEKVRNYEQLEILVRNLESVTREVFQKRMEAQYETVVRKLEQGVPLNDEERLVVEMLIVGDAKAYVKYENDFENWKQELHRLAQEIQRLKSSALDSSVEDLLHLQALCRDARGVLPDVVHYLRERERVQTFEGMFSQTLDTASCQFLAEIIRTMMSSQKV